MGKAGEFCAPWQGEVEPLLVSAKDKGPRLFRHVFAKVAAYQRFRTCAT